MRKTNKIILTIGILVFNSISLASIVSPDVDGIINDPNAISTTIAQQVSATETDLPLTSIPSLNSRPGAPISLYLDFVGAPAMTWLAASVPATPAYDQDGDPTTFNSAELTSITQIWEGVSEDYSPFNVNVTTVAPTQLVHGQNLEIIIGGSGSWLGVAAGGVSYIGAFEATYLPNISFVFPGELSNGTVKYVADAAAHEAGHEFGLYHQDTWSGTTLVSDYNYGNGQIGPIMGDPYGDTRAQWYDGTSDVGPDVYQDDMSVIASNTGFAPDITNTINTAIPINNFASGVIINTSDTDYYSFIVTTSGKYIINGNVAPITPMLDLSLYLYDQNDNLIASAATSSLSESLTEDLTAGEYFVEIASADKNYGDVGSYTLTIVPEPDIIAFIILFLNIKLFSRHHV